MRHSKNLTLCKSINSAQNQFNTFQLKDIDEITTFNCYIVPKWLCVDPRANENSIRTAVV